MVQTFYQIPLIPEPQTFQIQLAGVNYQLTVKWNDSADAGWQFDLADANTNTPLVAGQPFVTGADLLSGLDYLAIGGLLYVYQGGDPTAVPTHDNLGSECNLYFIVTN